MKRNKINDIDEAFKMNKKKTKKTQNNSGENPKTLKVRESFPRQVDKESRGPQGERGLEFSRRKKGQTFFSFSTFLRII